MNKVFLSYLFVLSIISMNIAAQSTAYKVSYDDEKFFDLEKNDIPVTANMPKSFTSYYVLETTPETSIYHVDKIKTEEEAKKNDNGRRWRWMRNNDDILYKNINEGRQIDQSDLFGKNFIVEDTCQTWKWKIYAAEQRDVQGFTCMKAVFQDSTTMLEAWFTPQIPISNGPHIYGGLPGLILEMRMENRHIVATKIEEYTQLEPYPTPSDGEVITKEEYDKIKEEKQKEREAMWKGGARKRRF
ncbi:MAG: GLPGLI family protein [Saprospiraceae bacterium]